MIKSQSKSSLLVICLIFYGFVFAQNERVFVSNYPLAYFTERILGKEVYFPEIEGDPAFWEPNQEDIAKIQAADLILLNGASYEKWQTTVSLPLSKVVETADAFSDQFIVVENEVTHSHGSSGEHSHAGTSFTTWLDFNQASRQAEVIKDALIEANIGSEEALTKQFNALRDDLLSLDARMVELSKGHEDEPLIASHPVYQYLARRYNLNIKVVHWEPDVYPSDDLWVELERLLLDQPAKWFIWESEPLAESVKKLESMGLKSVVFDPTGNRPTNGDFLTVMKSNLESLRTIFESR